MNKVLTAGRKLPSATSLTIQVLLGAEKIQVHVFQLTEFSGGIQLCHSAGQPQKYDVDSNDLQMDCDLQTLDFSTF